MQRGKYMLFFSCDYIIPLSIEYSVRKNILIVKRTELQTKQIWSFGGEPFVQL